MEFTLEKYAGATFRDNPKTSPIEILAAANMIDFDSYDNMKGLFKFALENIEVSSGENWVPVKTADKELYMPIGLEKDYKSMTALTKWYFQNVLMPVFTDSVE